MVTAEEPNGIYRAKIGAGAREPVNGNQVVGDDAAVICGGDVALAGSLNALWLDA